jgi:hypothetical protein
MIATPTQSTTPLSKVTRPGQAHPIALALAPNPLDLDLWRPLSRAVCRQALALPEDLPIVALLTGYRARAFSSGVALTSRNPNLQSSLKFRADGAMKLERYCSILRIHSESFSLS